LKLRTEKNKRNKKKKTKKEKREPLERKALGEENDFTVHELQTRK
jgi:hypothetical protein